MDALYSYVFLQKHFYDEFIAPTHHPDVEGGQPVSEAAVRDGLAADDAVGDGGEGGERLEEEQAAHRAEKVPGKN